MDPAALIPTPDTIPVHWSFFHILLLITFLLHILLMNIMLGTGFIAAVNHLRSEGTASPPTRLVADKLPFTMAFTVNFGVAPLLFAQVLYGQFIYASSILMAVYWLSVIAILITAYYLAYIYKYNYARLEAGRALLAVAITILLMAIGFIFSNNFTLMLHPDGWGDYFNRPTGFLLNLNDPTLLPRYLHFMASAVAVGGLSIAAYFTFKGEQDKQPWIEYGYKWFTSATIVNFAIGGWFLSSIPREFLIIDDLHSLLLVLFLFCGIIGAVIAMLFAHKQRPVPTITSLVATITLMILVRDQLRTAYLQPWFSPTELVVEPAYSPFLVFLATFIGGIVLIGWMLKLVFTNNDNREGQS